MTARSHILRLLADPTNGYLVLLAGGVLVMIELLRPGRGLAGVPGAVLVVLGCYSLANQPVTWYGLLLIGLSICLILGSLRTASYLQPLLSGAAVAVGSALLIESERIDAFAAATGGVFAFCCHWLLRLGYRARRAKRIDT